MTLFSGFSTFPRVFEESLEQYALTSPIFHMPTSNNVSKSQNSQQYATEQASMTRAQINHMALSSFSIWIYTIYRKSCGGGGQENVKKRKPKIRELGLVNLNFCTVGHCIQQHVHYSDLFFVAVKLTNAPAKPQAHCGCCFYSRFFITRKLYVFSIVFKDSIHTNRSKTWCDLSIRCP